MDQHLIHAANGLETVQLVLPRFELDVARFAGEPPAQGMHALPVRLEQAGDWILGKPVNLQIRVEVSEFPHNSEIAARMSETDW
jgi:hypothetical protein